MREGLETQAVRACPVEDDKNFGVISEVLTKCIHHDRRVGISAVSDNVALVHHGDGLEDFRVNAGVVVAGETAKRLHGRINVAGGWETGQISVLRADAKLPCSVGPILFAQSWHQWPARWRPGVKLEVRVLACERGRMGFTLEWRIDAAVEK